MTQTRIIGTDAVKSDLLALPDKLRREVVLKMSQIAHDTAHAGADKHTNTGALVQSLYNRALPGGGREVGHDPERAPHAIFVHWGTRPHTIRPKNKKALRWAVGGKFAFAKEVQHPGYKGDAWMVRAADDAVKSFAAIVDQAIKDAK